VPWPDRRLFWVREPPSPLSSGGAPFPIWNPLDDNRRVVLRKQSLSAAGPRSGPARRDSLHRCPGRDFGPSSVGVPGGFVGRIPTDVHGTTWATRRWTLPQIPGQSSPRNRELSRASSRWICVPQPHDIIRTWLFSSTIPALPAASKLTTCCVDERRGDLRMVLEPPDRQGICQVKGKTSWDRPRTCSGRFLAADAVTLLLTNLSGERRARTYQTAFRRASR